MDAALQWVRRHLARNASVDQTVFVNLYGPDGKLLRRIRAPQGEGGDTPVEEHID